MAGDKYLDLASGIITEKASTTTSAGAGDAGKIVGLNGSGQVDLTMMPTGIGPDTLTVPAKEAIAAGAFVNLVLDTTLKAQNADNTAASAAKACDGFVLTAQPTPGQNILVYLSGINNALSGLTPLGGVVWLGAAGASTTTAPSASGYTSQRIGKILTTGSIQFDLMDPIVLA